MNTSAEAKFRSLSKRAAECQRQIGRLSNVDSNRTREETAAQIRSDLRQLDQDIKFIHQLIEQEDEESSRKILLNKLKEYEQQFSQLQSSSRNALWASKRRLEEQEQQMRFELFGKKDQQDFEQYELKLRRNQGQDELLLRAHTDVTEALRRTSTLMQQELEKSSYSTGMLVDSSRTLHSTYSEYQSFGSLLTISKRLVGQLETADWLDRLSLLFGLGVFMLVVAYIIKKRTYDVGISWASWIMGKASVSKTAASFVGETLATATSSVMATTASSSTTDSIILSTTPSTMYTIETTLSALVKDEL
ncbi:Sec20-domain-containing protein [Lichtheimia hyalospora FSU 10163]|nr:Sec20-domain-containing protein [Lichtheimia hyalospora FSU 10163]